MPRGIYERSEEYKSKMLNHPVPEETRRKLSESHKGQISWIKGKHHTEETCMKLSEGHKGQKLSEEQKQKISISNKGKKKEPQQEIHRRKLSEINKKYNYQGWEKEELERRWYLIYDGAVCEVCGMTNKQYIQRFKGKSLNWHHKDPSTKCFELSTWIQHPGLTDEEGLKEKSKCVCLCHGCHRTEHSLNKRG